MNNTKTWSILCVVLSLALLLASGGLTTMVDPFFHYHAPMENLLTGETEQHITLPGYGFGVFKR